MHTFGRQLYSLSSSFSTTTNNYVQLQDDGIIKQYYMVFLNMGAVIIF